MLGQTKSLTHEKMRNLKGTPNSEHCHQADQASSHGIGWSLVTPLRKYKMNIKFQHCKEMASMALTTRPTALWSIEILLEQFFIVAIHVIKTSVSFPLSRNIKLEASFSSHYRNNKLPTKNRSTISVIRSWRKLTLLSSWLFFPSFFLWQRQCGWLDGPWFILINTFLVYGWGCCACSIGLSILWP